MKDFVLTGFLAYIETEKGLSKNTVEAYYRDILYFQDFLYKKKIGKFQDVTPDEIVQYLSFLKNSYAPSSIVRILISIKVFFRFLKKEEIIKKDITKYLEQPKVWSFLPSVLTCLEMENLLKQPDLSTFMGVRDKAIMELLYATGIRVSEACNVRLIDITKDNFIKVKGKGKKDRIIPIGNKAMEAVNLYISKYRKMIKGSDFLFVSKNQKKIDRVTIWNRIKFYAKKAGIRKNISPHTFRHSCATHLLENEADLRFIQEILGHEDISTTDKYTHISKAYIQKSFKNFHPRP